MASRKTRRRSGTPAPLLGFFSPPIPFYPPIEFGIRGEAIAHLRVGVANFCRFKAELVADVAAGLVVVLFSDGIVEGEFGFALGGVDFYGDGNGRAEEDAILALFSDEQVAFFKGEALAEFGRDHEGSAFPDFGGLHSLNL